MQPFYSEVPEQSSYAFVDPAQVQVARLPVPPQGSLQPTMEYVTYAPLPMASPGYYFPAGGLAPPQIPTQVTFPPQTQQVMYAPPHMATPANFLPGAFSAYPPFFGTPTQYVPQPTTYNATMVPHHHHHAHHQAQAPSILPLPDLPPLAAPAKRTAKSGLRYPENPFQGVEDPEGTDPPPPGFVPVYRSHEKWKESHVKAITAPFKGSAAEFVIRGCLPFLFSAHASVRSHQWCLVLGVLKLPKEALIELTKHIDAIWKVAAPTLPVERYLTMPLFAFGAGSITGLPNGEFNPISFMRRQAPFQFSGFTTVGVDGVERQSATQYSDVPCKDHIPGVLVCRRATCRFAHVD